MDKLSCSGFCFTPEYDFGRGVIVEIFHVALERL